VKVSKKPNKKAGARTAIKEDCGKGGGVVFSRYASITSLTYVSLKSLLDITNSPLTTIELGRISVYRLLFQSIFRSILYPFNQYSTFILTLNFIHSLVYIQKLFIFIIRTRWTQRRIPIKELNNNILTRISYFKRQQK